MRNRANPVPPSLDGRKKNISPVLVLSSLVLFFFKFQRILTFSLRTTATKVHLLSKTPILDRGGGGGYRSRDPPPSTYKSFTHEISKKTSENAC